MAEKHPTELELLSFVEEELGDDVRRDVGEHLVACRPCADQIRRLEAAREALRSASPLELPDERRGEIFASLPERRDPWRRFRPARRVLVIAAPVAAAAALAAVFVVGGTQLGSSGDDDSEAADVAAEESGGAETTSPMEMDATTTTTAEQAAPADAPEGATFVLFAQGPAAEIVRVLAGEGITAEVDPGGGVVAEARAGEVRAALAGRATGDVPVYVR
jgi:anti-sigma factor RsiW